MPYRYYGYAPEVQTPPARSSARPRAPPRACAAPGRHTDFALGTINTAVLLTSSLAMALAVCAAAIRRRRWAVLLLGATLTLGVAFLVIKGFEYRAEYLQHLVPGADFRFDAAQRHAAELFFWLYF